MAGLTHHLARLAMPWLRLSILPGVESVIVVVAVVRKVL